MKLKQLLLLFLLPLWSYAQPCATGMKTVVVRIVPDQYPQESSWILQSGNGTLLGSGGAVSDTICVPANTCMTFTMNDSYGDGMCCTYGNGSFTVFVDGVIVAAGGQFTFQSVHSFNCAPGQSCDSALVADTLQYTAPTRNSWYKFKPRQTGAYAFYTCGLPNSCNTTLWVYDNCSGPVLSSSNIGTIFYNDDFPGCGQLSRIDAILDTSTTYYIRVGGDTSCSGPINFSIQYIGVLMAVPIASHVTTTPWHSLEDHVIIFQAHFVRPAPTSPLCRQPSKIRCNSTALTPKIVWCKSNASRVTACAQLFDLRLIFETSAKPITS